MPDRQSAIGAGAALLAAVFDGLDSETVGRSTDGGLFIPSPLSDLRLLFDRLPLADYTSFADLGSGDGRVALLASLHTRATGLEMDPALTAAARARAMSLGLERASFRTADFLTADLSAFDLLFIYPDKPLDKLAAVLNGRFNGRLLVYGPGFTMSGFEELARFNLPINKARLLAPVRV